MWLSAIWVLPTWFRSVSFLSDQLPASVGSAYAGIRYREVEAVVGAQSRAGIVRPLQATPTLVPNEMTLAMSLSTRPSELIGLPV